MFVLIPVFRGIKLITWPMCFSKTSQENSMAQAVPFITYRWSQGPFPSTHVYQLSKPCSLSFLEPHSSATSLIHGYEPVSLLVLIRHTGKREFIRPREPRAGSKGLAGSAFATPTASSFGLCCLTRRIGEPFLAPPFSVLLPSSAPLLLQSQNSRQFPPSPWVLVELSRAPWM